MGLHYHASHSTRVRGLKSSDADVVFVFGGASHSTRVRGLKLRDPTAKIRTPKVALYTSAWIEMI